MAATKEAQAKKKYLVTNRLISWVGDDGEEVHAEEGEVRDDITPAALKYFLADGAVAEYEEDGGNKSARDQETPVSEAVDATVGQSEGEVGSDAGNTN